MRVKVNVTQHHIDNAVHRSSDRCVVALALSGVLSKGYVAGCGTYQFNIKNADSLAIAETIELPAEASVVIRAFDNNYVVIPCEFQIEIPDQYLDSNLLLSC